MVVRPEGKLRSQNFWNDRAELADGWPTIPGAYLEVYMVVLDVGQSVVGMRDDGSTPAVADGLEGLAPVMGEEDSEEVGVEVDGVDEELEEDNVLGEETRSARSILP